MPREEELGAAATATRRRTVTPRETTVLIALHAHTRYSFHFILFDT
jgi:hypothetical protein